jgi:small multidrug resistance pump
MIGWLYLLGAITAEVVATTALRAAQGGQRAVPMVLVCVGYPLAFLLLSRTLQHLPLGVAYAVWSGVGTIGAVGAGWLLFGERLGWSVVAGVALVMAGTAVLHLGQAPPAGPRAEAPSAAGSGEPAR